ncbi:hypothetical protein A2291_02710 [candidate division WOR-1 bacterium RIFOXYB2_FULL_42_35]|uniref:Type I restriction modification DNA specificity domain-containing protein n=1 Tax=candidate division WOR-1 bacterium RIFOXYC2_FULL_41_25 TaxID=1802586 RepID=A0A1F4TJR5_UNCSA|nr:MAG: hypothetical protein A2247_04170 [candidate division WOR-1 bacterium RIFOXYA2_FULL_41_14]OGC22076.1 MAG: hypothetical protein A2291_02710 [candidate division WOR-1 bacterium RIFOXYB2_FULL_42_35]OGC32837.1 MAG: hypothetical protein A2462_06510 [candidate division WOR-1 bacterium RIFOXYC2_FULL_41_25]OGC44153.1 MAG: hypothetical protein A2548_03090 [candidate division WOR-1 bacterium RIFOXYD2_FULL_41_8]
MKNWQTKKLGEICDLQNGFAFKSKDYVEKSNTMNFRMSQIRPGGGIDLDNNPKYLPDNYAALYKEYLLKDGDLVIAMTDMATETKILGVPTMVITDGKKLLLNQRVGRLFEIDLKQVFVPFLCSMLTSPQIKDYYKGLGRGGLQINIGKQEILNAIIPLPPVSEQRRIVKKLDKIFAAIEKAKKSAQKNLANARELFESYLQSVFSNPGEGWEEKKIGQIAVVEYGFTDKARDEGDFRFIRITDIDKNGCLINEDKKYINSSKEAQKYLLNNDDLLMARTGATFAKVLLYKDSEKSVFASYLIKIRFTENILNELYWFFSKTKSYWDQANTLSSGSAQPQFNGAALKEVVFTYPKSATKQKAMVSKFNALSAQTKKLEAIYRQKLADLEELKKAVLKKAFSGEL